MKTLFAVIILAVAAGAQTAPANTAVPQDASSRKAQQLIDECIQALGGQAWLNVQDSQMEGRTYGFYHGQPNSLGTVFWRFWKFPDKERIELTKKRDVVYINAGDQGYEITYKGTAAEEPDALKDYLRRRAHSLDTVLRVWLKEPGTALFYDGPAVAEQKATDSVTIMHHDDSVTLFLDTATHLPVKKIFVWRDKDRYRNEEGEVFDNWRAVQGIMTPHSTLRYHNGDMTNQRFITNVKYNVGLADSMFAARVTYDPYKRSGKRE
jgi:hypothetical protein